MPDGVHTSGRRVRVMVILAILAAAAGAQADPGWKLIYCRQIGQAINNNNRTLHCFLYQEDGTRGRLATDPVFGLTDAAHPGTVLYNPNSDGYHGLPMNPLFGPLYYDLQVWDPTTASQASRWFYFRSSASGRYYSFETHWLKVSDQSRVWTQPYRPVYHYDSVQGFCGSAGNPPANFAADEYALSASPAAPFQAQSFVVPPGINRIMSAKAMVMVSPGVNFRYQASIHQGATPDGEQIGPTVLSRSISSPPGGLPEFLNVGVNWGLEQVPVEAGQSYCLKIAPFSGASLNAYVTKTNTYPQGQAFHGGLADSGHDLVAVVVGVGYDVHAGGPVLGVDPEFIRLAPFSGGTPPGETQLTLGITNEGTGGMNYTLSKSEDAAWLTVHSSSGSVTTQTQAIPVTVNASGLTPQKYEASITVSAGGAGSRSVLVRLLGPTAPCDFDEDADVDMEDFGRFQACFTGSGGSPALPECAGAMLDADGDVDLDDLARFNNCLAQSGPGIPLADVTCSD